ncbi:MAG: hypothetical protein PHY09_03930 [Desulfuromonadaceae bacterium]|nr:hypothetical protein [Desulfuromonadaceae bacterium]MDD5106678.1 hypothetical protein [Desulfuromonadaceae bacterium]
MTDIVKDHFDRIDVDAKSVFESLEGKDPLEHIDPALLNSADIFAYAAKTAMIWPFCHKNLKSASYEVDFIGTIIYWDEAGNKKTERIEDDGVFILPKHSIAFISPDLYFRLPDYLAVRFNLQIKLVHSGILLGTGPLVDPGFEGQLLIPLHNLTNNDYLIKGGEGLIWVEFTKVSNNPRWRSNNESYEFSNKYIPFPVSKKNKKPEEFLGKALAGQSFNYIHSSIPSAISKAIGVEKTVSEMSIKLNKDITDANELINKTITDVKDKISKQKTFDIVASFAVAVALVGVMASLYSVHVSTRSIVQDAVNYVKNNQKYFDNISTTLSMQKKKIDELERKLAQKSR